MAAHEPDHHPAFPTEADIYEFKGDAREAVRALLHDLAILAGDYEADVSRGFVRGGVPKIMIRRV